MEPRYPFPKSITVETGGETNYIGISSLDKDVYLVYFPERGPGTGTFIFVGEGGLWGYDTVGRTKQLAENGNPVAASVWKLYEENHIGKKKVLSLGETCPKCKSVVKHRELFLSVVADPW